MLLIISIEVRDRYALSVFCFEKKKLYVLLFHPLPVHDGFCLNSIQKY